jgi:hypothetical protein
MSICNTASLRGSTLASVRRPRLHRAFVVSSAHALVSAAVRGLGHPSHACTSKHCCSRGTVRVVGRHHCILACRSPRRCTRGICPSWAARPATSDEALALADQASHGRGIPGDAAPFASDSGAFRVRPARARSSATHSAVCCSNQFLSISSASYRPHAHGSST